MYNYCYSKLGAIYAKSLWMGGVVHRRITSSIQFSGSHQSPIKLCIFQFCIFSVRFSVYVFCPSVLSFSNLKVHKR